MALHRTVCPIALMLPSLSYLAIWRESGALGRPIFPGASKTLHWNFDDPAQATGTYEQRLIVFRKTRDEIADRVRRFITESL